MRILDRVMSIVRCWQENVRNRVGGDTSLFVFQIGNYISRAAAGVFFALFLRLVITVFNYPKWSHIFLFIISADRRRSPCLGWARKKKTLSPLMRSALTDMLINGRLRHCVLFNPLHDAVGCLILTKFFYPVLTKNTFTLRYIPILPSFYQCIMLLFFINLIGLFVCKNGTLSCSRPGFIFHAPIENFLNGLCRLQLPIPTKLKEYDWRFIRHGHN